MMVVLGACGGDDGISEEDFQEAAAEPCKDFADAIEDLEDDDESDGKDKVDEIEDLAEALEDVEPAEATKETFAELLEQLDEVSSIVDDIDEALEDADLDEFSDLLEDVEKAREDAADTAGELGLDDCERGLSSSLVDTTVADGDDDDDEDEDPLSKGDSIDALEDVCGDLEDAAADLPEPSSNADFPALIELAEGSLANFAEAASALADINAAAEIEDDFDDLRDLVDDQIRHFEALLDAAEAEDEALVEDALDNLQDTTAEAAELMAAMGADNCVD